MVPSQGRIASRLRHNEDKHIANNGSAAGMSPSGDILRDEGSLSLSFARRRLSLSKTAVKAVGRRS